MTIVLNAEKVLIFRITHIANVPWTLRNGLHCAKSPSLDPDFIPVGNLDLIGKRRRRAVPAGPGGTLDDYIPFYFTPFSMMMYNITTGLGGVKQIGNHDLVILVSSLRLLFSQGVRCLFSDRHALLHTARFFDSPDHLPEIDWGLLRSRDFRRDTDDPDKTARYQAEALVYRHLPAQYLKGIVCHGQAEKRKVIGWTEEAGVAVPVFAQPSWYF